MAEGEFLTPEETEKIPSPSGPLSSLPSVVEEGKTLVQTKAPGITAMAVQVPRSIQSYEAAMRDEAQRAGANFYYAWPVQTKEGQKWVKGPTIKMANTALRNFKNISVDIAIVNETSEEWVFAAYVLDREMGVTRSSLFRQRKHLNLGKKMDRDRRLDIAFQIGQAKCIRNAVLNYVPDYITDDLVEVAMKFERKKITEANVGEKAGGALDAFIKEMASSMGAADVENRICATLGRTIKQWNPDDVISLREKYGALAERWATFDELFPEPFEPEPAEPPQAEEKAVGAPLTQQGETAPGKDQGDAGEPPKAPQEQPKPGPTTSAPKEEAPPHPATTTEPEPEKLTEIPKKRTRKPKLKDADRPLQPTCDKLDHAVSSFGIKPEWLEAAFLTISNGFADGIGTATADETVDVLKLIYAEHGDPPPNKEEADEEGKQKGLDL